MLILSCTILRARYRLTHIGGMALGLMSVVVLVWTDVQDGRGGVSAGGKQSSYHNVFSFWPKLVPKSGWYSK